MNLSPLSSAAPALAPPASPAPPVIFQQHVHKVAHRVGLLLQGLEYDVVGQHVLAGPQYHPYLRDPVLLAHALSTPPPNITYSLTPLFLKQRRPGCEALPRKVWYLVSVGFQACSLMSTP